MHAVVCVCVYVWCDLCRGEVRMHAGDGCIHVSIYPFIYVCVCICMCMYMHICHKTDVRIYGYMPQTDVCIYSGMYAGVYACMYVAATCMDVCNRQMKVCTQVCMQVCMHACSSDLLDRMPDGTNAHAIMGFDLAVHLQFFQTRVR